MPRILFAAIPDSIHAVRWINQLAGTGWEIHLIAVYKKDFHKDFNPLIVKHPINTPYEPGFDEKVKLLEDTITAVKPDIIHSLETQRAGYMTVSLKKKYGDRFPRWIHSNWGSDIYLFGRLAEHRERIKEVMQHCDYYFCECERDIRLGKQFGLKGKALPVFPNSGGFDLEEIAKIREPYLPPSQRKNVMLKGYQGWAGRALAGIRALERCRDILKGYTVVIFSANTPEVKISAELFRESTGIPTYLPNLHIPHREILALHGSARLTIGLSISDAISTSLLEAMVMGDFPIQAGTSCADEWIQDGVTGILVPPEDPDVIEIAIRRALFDDNLVDNAAVMNFNVARQRLDQKTIIPQVIKIYEEILTQGG